MVNNNWYRYRYDNQEYNSPKTNINQKFTTDIFTKNTKILPYKEALIYNAKQIVSDFNNKKFALMLSGGSDSEVMLRSCLEAGVNFKTYIFRFENDFNIYDVSYAIALCESCSIDYHLVDFNVKKFYETEAVKLSILSQTDRPRALPQLKFLDYIDEESCLYGQGDINWKRLNDIDYTTKGIWVHSCNEHEIAWEKYLRATNRIGVALWFKYTPELQLATALNNWSQALINDKIYGKTGTNTTKLLGYKEAYPYILNRVKKTGLEKIDITINEVEHTLSVLNNGLHYRQSYYRPANEYIKELKGI
jgi:hypothetical protein